MVAASQAAGRGAPGVGLWYPRVRPCSPTSAPPPSRRPSAPSPDRAAAATCRSQSGKAVKTIFFDHGRIVFAASNLKKDRLGEALVALGRITDEQFNQASALLGGERKRSFGEALVQAGIMDKTELGRSVARQVNRIALSVFPFSDGVATFDERALRDPARVHGQPVDAPPPLRRHPAR